MAHSSYSNADKAYSNEGFEDEESNLSQPVEETVAPCLPIQEKGPEKLQVKVRLYDVTETPRRSGSFMIKFMPRNMANMLTDNMAHSAIYSHPHGCVNGPAEECFTWEVEINNKLSVDVKMLGSDDCTILFTTKKTLTRRDILSESMYRLPNDCATIEFTINSQSERTCERRFTVKVTTDADPNNPQSRDYNVMFIRMPQESEETQAWRI